MKGAEKARKQSEAAAKEQARQEAKQHHGSDPMRRVVDWRNQRTELQFIA
jgi:hypothetical protein